VDDDRDAASVDILEQHRRLDALLRDVREALRVRDAGRSAREAFTLLREALETHFEQEDRLYHPAIWSLACLRAHEEFRSMLRDVAGLLESGAVEQAAHTFDLLVEGFARHEAAEEGVLAEIEHELAHTVRAEHAEP
jgi:predicted metal-dependent HD superfamily phosphohydrolase